MASEIAKREKYDIASDMDEQRALFRRLGVSEGLIFSHAIIPVPGGGHQLVERKSRIDMFDIDLKGNTTVVRSMGKTYSERMGLSKMRGKYNDEGRLMGNDYGTAEVGEFAPFATI